MTQTSPETRVFGPIAVTSDGPLAVIRIDNPPVNAISAAVRDGLTSAWAALEADPTIEAAVLIGAGKFFIAGADITEFGKPPIDPILPLVIATIEDSRIPAVAAIQGAALGGGLEIALACGHRVAASGSKLGLPETGLGLIPGSGGTQRTPRLIGIEATLAMVTSGNPISAEEGLEKGLVDDVCAAEDLLETAKALALSQIGQARRRTGDLPRPDAVPDIKASYEAKYNAAKPGQFALAQAVASVCASAETDIAEGQKQERARFLQCLESDERAGLIHAFFAERRCRQVPEVDQGTAVAIRKAGVIGGGTMGAGIAAAMLLKGIEVRMVERDAAAAANGRANVEKILDGSVKRGKMSTAERDRILSEVYDAGDRYEALADADLVIEAVFEDMDVKHAVFSELDRVCKPGCILATNTSYLDIDAIAAKTSRPEAVIGLHFFSPAHVMKLLEIVVAEKTGMDAVATGFALAKTLGKVPVRAGVCDGFIGNRILQVYRNSADAMMLDGASPYAIDAAVRSFGFPMGPYQVSDLAGLDIAWANRKRKAPTRDPRTRYVAILDRLCEKGWFGRKTGRGVYRYDGDNPKGAVDPDVESIIAAEREANKITPRSFTPEDITRRYLAAMVNEAAKVVAEGIALRPSDVDVTLLYGYGFPRYRGGPMHYADRVGLPALLADIERYAEEDAFFWEPAPLLRDLVASGRCFEDLNG